MKIFLSWSGDQSKEIAGIFNSWLPRVIQAVKPWFSPEIEKGANWFTELDNALAGTRFGIVCLTPNNLQNPWLHYEVGALSKTEGARIWTFLHGGITVTDVGPPLGRFQHTVAEKSDVLRLLRSINDRLSEDGGNGLPDSLLNEVFEDAWPKLDSYFRQVKYDKPEANQPPKRGEREILEEILELVRGYPVQIEQMKVAIMDTNGLSRSQRLDHFRPAKEISFLYHPVKEIEAIFNELRRGNKALVLHILDVAQSLELSDGTLTVTLANDDIFAKQLRGSDELFRDIGQRLFGYSIKLRIRIATPKSSPAASNDDDDDFDPPSDNDIPF
jgi:hypothetical protein